MPTSLKRINNNNYNNPKKKKQKASSSKQAAEFSTTTTTTTATTSSSYNGSHSYPITTTLNPPKFKALTSKQVCTLLALPEEQGGAQLSLLKTQPLLDVNFDGISINNIMEDINRHGINNAITSLTNQFNDDILFSTLEAIVYWVDKLLKRLSYDMKTPHSIIGARTDAKFEYLRNLENNPHKWNELELKIGQHIELPTIGEAGTQFVPKDYEPNIPYLLTKQRYDILKQVVTNNNTDDGFVLSGPQGVSKSYTMLLIVAYCIVNSLPVLYVPLCGIWVSKYTDGGIDHAEDFLRTLFIYYNYDILSPQTIDKLLNTREDVVSCLASNLVGTSIFLLFDEHNELFEQPLTNGVVPINETYFYNYSKWTGCIPTGTMSIYCGSAHSQFEDNLPSGGGDAQSNIIRIIPPNHSEFQKLLLGFGFKQLNKERINRVEYATGRMPSEVQLFTDFVKGNNNFTDEQVKQFVINRQDVYMQRIDRLVNEETNDNIQNFLTSIHYLFNLVFSDDNNSRINVKPPGSFYDLGIFYKTQDDKLYPINEAAKRALFAFYVKKNNAVHVLDEIINGQVECDLKRLIIRNEYKLGKSNHIYHLINSSSNTISKCESIEYTINSMVDIDIHKGLNDLRFLSRNFWPVSESILFIPESKKFPSLDYFIVTYMSEKKIQIVFKQVTLSTVDTHYYGDDRDFTILFSPKYLVSKNEIYCPTARNIKYIHIETKDGSIISTEEYRYSLFELIIHSIMDNYNECTSVIIVKEKKAVMVNEILQCELRKKKFTYKDNPKLERTLIVDGVEISWYFVYESFISEADQKTKSVKYSNVCINYRNKEDLERDYLLV